MRTTPGLFLFEVKRVANNKLGGRNLKYVSPLMRGNDVALTQTALNELGFDCGEADGIFGKKTLQGVKAFQQAAGIEVDGIFGPDSLRALKAAQSLTDPTIFNTSGFEIHGFIPDVSAYQEKIDMDAFCAGNDFAFFRARVNGKDDIEFADWAKDLVKRDFPFAVYDYLRLKSDDHAVEQAEAMFKACNTYKPRIYYLDTENPADDVTYDQEKKYIETYVKTLRKLGVKCIGQYTGDYRWCEYYRDIDDLFDTLWIARWGKDNGKPDGIVLNAAKYTDKVALYQYTSCGNFRVAGAPGIKTRVDLNQLTGVKPLTWFTGRIYKTADAGFVRYVVQAKDTLWGIAEKFYGKGNKYQIIMDANNMTSTIIHGGDVLFVPKTVK